MKTKSEDVSIINKGIFPEIEFQTMIMLDREKIEQFQKVVYRFFRDNDVNRKEMAELLKLQFENFASDDEKSYRSWEDQRKRLSKEAIDDFP